jgi:ABC-2 type transport system ATP-binding protein
MGDKGTAMLKVEDLEKRFGSFRALDGIDMLLDGPGVYGFLGPNGAGKTTTFKLIGGLLRPTGGSVSIGGYDVVRDTTRAVSKLGILFDQPAYYPYLTGRENLSVFNMWMGRRDSGSADRLLGQVGLGGAGRKKVGGYSWGMKRRLGIAAALLGDPEMLLLDEPTNGLDPAGIADMRDLLPRLAWDEGKTVLLSSHRMEEVSQICDHVMIINRGRIAASGTPADLASGDPLIEIETPEAGRAVEVLTRAGIAGDINRKSATVIEIASAGAGPSAINRLLVGEGVEISGMREKRESLEDIFFRLTKEDGDDQ